MECMQKSFQLPDLLLHKQSTSSPHDTFTVSCSKSWHADTWEKMGSKQASRWPGNLKKTTSADSWQQGGRDLAAFPISSCCFYSRYMEVKVFLLPQAGIRQGALQAISYSYFTCQQITRY